MTQAITTPPTIEAVDTAVHDLFLTESAQNEGNIQFVSNRILSHPQKHKLLRLYSRVYRGKKVADDRQDPLQNQLKLTGLVKVAGNELQLRNEIYRYAFDAAWLRRHTAVSRPLIAAVAALTIALLLIGLLLYDNALLPQQAQAHANAFRQSAAAPTSAAALTQLLSLQPVMGTDRTYRYHAYDLFFNLPDRVSQEAIVASVDNATDLNRLVRHLYVTLADVDERDQTRPLLQVMARSLAHFPQDETAVQLQQEIDLWLEARTFVYGQAYNQALERYNAALTLNPQNPAILYERATVYARQERFVSAAQDLEQVLTLAATELGTTAVLPTATMTPLPTIGPLPTSPFNRLTEIEAVTRVVIAATATAVATLQLPTPMPTNIPLPRPTPDASAIPAQFTTRNQRLNAVRRLIARYPAFSDALALMPTTTYPNLTRTGLVPSLTFRVLYLPLDEPKASVQFQDQSGYEHHANCRGSACPSLISRQAGNARQFDGVDDVLLLAQSPNLEIVGDITIVAWVRPSSADDIQTIVTKGYTRIPEDREIILRINRGNYQVGSWDGDEHFATAPVPLADLGRWVHLAGVYDGEAWRLYRDGVLMSETAATTGALLVNASWAVGARSDGSERFFMGGIDDVLIYNRALSAAEVLALYTNG